MKNENCGVCGHALKDHSSNGYCEACLALIYETDPEEVLQAKRVRANHYFETPHENGPALGVNEEEIDGEGDMSLDHADADGPTGYDGEEA